MKFIGYATLLLIAGIVAPARAALVVTIEDKPVPVGQSPLVDVYVYSTESSGEALNAASLLFQVTRVSGSGYFDFDSTLGNAALASLVSNPQFIFYDATNPPTATGSVLTTTLPNDTYKADTNYFDPFSDVTVGFGPSNRSLLMELALKPESGINMPAIDSVFQIALIPTSGGNSTLFVDSSFNQLSYDARTPGTLTVTAVPEPNSLALTLCAGACLVCRAGLPRARKAREKANRLTA